MKDLFRNIMHLRNTILLVTVAALVAAIKEPELPLCPTNIQFFPQNLPMHCRMPRSVAAAPPGLSMPPGMQMPQGLMPPMQMPGLQMPPGAQMPMPMTAQVPMPAGPMTGGPMMPMMMPGPPAGAKLPVIVMPFYKPEKNYGDNQKPNNIGKPWWSDSDRSHEKGHHNHKWWDHDSDSDTDSSSSTDTDSDTDGYSIWRGRRAGGGKPSRKSSSSKKHHRRHKSHKTRQSPLYTPVLQYVTKDGYVIYEKKISTGEAKDWLSINTKDKNERQNREDVNASVDNDEDNLMENLHEQRRRPKAEVEHVEPVVIHKKKNPRASQLKNKPGLHTNSRTRS